MSETLYERIIDGRECSDVKTLCASVCAYYTPLLHFTELETPESATYTTIINTVNVFETLADPTFLFEGERYADVLLELFELDLTKRGTKEYKAIIRQAYDVFVEYKATYEEVR